MNVVYLQQDFNRAAEQKPAATKIHDYEIETFYCIGAIPDAADDEHGLSSVDHKIYREVLNTIATAWRMPTAKAFQKKVLNIDPAYGGEDFLQADVAKDRPDVVILHHIPKDTDHVNEELNHGARGITGGDALKTVGNAFASSVHHHSLRRWQDQIAAADAKIVFIYGSDSFDAEHLLTDDFVAVPDDLLSNRGVKWSNSHAILIRKDYLGQIAAFGDDADPKMLDFAMEHGELGRTPRWKAPVAELIS